MTQKPEAHGEINRRGFGLKDQVKDALMQDYHSALIARIREGGNRWRVGGIELRLARAFGFCYGVDKAVALAYETRRHFP